MTYSGMVQDARTRFWCRDRPGDPFPNPTSHLHDQSYAAESGEPYLPPLERI